MARNIAREGEEPDYKEIEDPNLIKVMWNLLQTLHVHVLTRMLYHENVSWFCIVFQEASVAGLGWRS